MYPLVTALSNVNQQYRYSTHSINSYSLRCAFKHLAINAGLELKSEQQTQLDLDEENRILENFKKREIYSNDKPNNILEIEVGEGDNETINQTYKMIMSHDNIGNQDDFSIEDDSDEGEEDEEDEEYERNEGYSEDKYNDLLNNVNIEPIAEEDGEESKYMPTPQKQITSKMGTMTAVECVKALRAKELEKRLELDEQDAKNVKTFKSADAQKPKATIKDPKNAVPKHLPPKIPNRSSTSNDNPKSTIPASYLKSSKALPSTTKASTVSETPKSSSGAPLPRPVKKSTLNDSKMSAEGEKVTAET